MPTLAINFNWGSALKNANPELTRQLSESYTQISLVVNSKTSKYVTDGKSKPHSNPPANSRFNQNFEIGDFYIRTDSDEVWIMTNRVSSVSVTWKQII